MPITLKRCMQLTLIPAMLIFAAGLSLFATSTPVARALDRSTNISQAVQLDSPAVVRIISVVTGQLFCPGCAPDGSNINSPQTGAFQWADSGSGAFISPDGYILTADHVVDHTTNNPGDVDFLINTASTDIAQQYGITQSQALQLLQNNANSIQIAIQVQSQQVFLSTAYTGQLQNTAQLVSYPLTRIVASSAVDQQDTAIIQITAHDMPFLKVAQNSTINVGDTVTAIGYPGDADCVVNGCDFTALLTPSQSSATVLSSLLDLSSNSGQITSQKTLQDGTPVYEVGGEIASAGSSGGPVIDQQGNIMGFVDAGINNNRLAVVLPSSVIQSYVQQAGISNPHGNFMSLWTQALNNYNSTAPCHWKLAGQQLTQLHSNYPQFGAVLPLLQNAQTNATPASCPATTPPAQSNGLLLPLMIGGGALLVVILAGLGLLFLLRRRKQPAPAAPMTAPMQTPAPAPISSPGFPQWNAQNQQFQPYQQHPMTPPFAGSTGYGANGWNTLVDSQGVTYPASAGLAAQSPTPVFSPTPEPMPTPAPAPMPPYVRRCSNGHTIYEREARFCPECGSLAHEIPVAAR